MSNSFYHKINTTALTLEDVARLRSLPPDATSFSLSPRRRASDSELSVHIISPQAALTVALGPNLKHIRGKHAASQPQTSTLTLTQAPPPAAVTTHPQQNQQPGMSTIPVLPLLRGDYLGGEEPNEWMRQLDLNLPSTWTDAQKVERFRRQCAPGSLEEAWYATLTTAQTATWTDLETAFLVRWPTAPPLQLTAAQKKEQLKAVVLKEADIGTMLDDDKGQEWGHVRWARQVQRLAQSFGDHSCQFLDVVLDGVPDLLRDQLADAYTDWAAFLASVNGISINLLTRARARAEEERAMREDIAQLKARLQPQQQQPSAQTYAANSPAYRPYPRSTNIAAATPIAPAPLMTMPQTFNQAQPNLAPTMQYQMPPYQPQPAAQSYQQQPSTPGQNLFAATGAVPSTNLFYRYQQFPQTPSRPSAVDRIRIAAQYSMLQHHPDSETGQIAYAQQVKEWHDKHGTDTMPHTGRPYPLRPGSAPLGSRECFTCGLITTPPHQAASCPNTPAAPQETKWREIVSSMVGRAIRNQNQPTTPSAAVQYVATAPMQEPIQSHTLY